MAKNVEKFNHISQVDIFCHIFIGTFVSTFLFGLRIIGNLSATLSNGKKTSATHEKNESPHISPKFLRTRSVTVQCRDSPSDSTPEMGSCGQFAHSLAVSVAGSL